jgi:ketosteroid isomerase-like protein
MTTLRIDLASFPDDHEHLGDVTTPLEIEYSRETGQIEDGWIVEHIGGDMQHYRHIGHALAWSLLGGRTAAVRAYLDQLAEEARAA